MEHKAKKPGKAGPVDLAADAPEMAQINLEQARDALAKLPILGPALWLYARDPNRKYNFIADTEWLVLPPIVLDQCRLYNQAGIPVAFFTWAQVSDAVDARLRSGVAKIAPHEWNCGPHTWLIDMVSPFSPADAMLEELRRTALAGQALRALLPDPQHGGRLAVREWPPVLPAVKH